MRVSENDYEAHEYADPYQDDGEDDADDIKEPTMTQNDPVALVAQKIWNYTRPHSSRAVSVELIEQFIRDVIADQTAELKRLREHISTLQYQLDTIRIHKDDQGRVNLVELCRYMSAPCFCGCHTTIAKEAGGEG